MKHLSAQGAATPRAGEGYGGFPESRVGAARSGTHHPPVGVPNGGFPEPAAGEPMRVVACAHAGCGETRVRLPFELPVHAVRHVVCASCAESFECDAPTDLGLLAMPGSRRLARPSLSLPRLSVPPPALSMPRMSVSLPRPAFAMPSMPSVSLPRFERPKLALPRPEGRLWRYGSVVVAAAAVVGALMLVQGWGDTSDTGGGTTTEPTGEGAASSVRKGDASMTAAGGGEQALAEPAAAARLVRQSSFTVALPAGWERLAPAGGATFSAASAGGDADATLWIERDSKLDLAEFETRSLAQLETLAGSARVTGRVAAPTIEGTIITLAADAPEGGPRYEVVLRAAGNYRYYLATTLRADASREAIAGVELIRGSFTPEVG